MTSAEFELALHQLKKLAGNVEFEALFRTEYEDRVRELCAGLKSGDLDQADFLSRSMKLKSLLVGQMIYMVEGAMQERAAERGVAQGCAGWIQ